MLLNNPLQMNDWKFSQFIKLILLIQFLQLIFVGLNLKGINIPVIAQLIGFIYLTFIPGYLILRILKIHEIGNVKSLLYSVGLSIASVMFIGFIINMALPLIGIYNPLSIIPLTVSITLYVIVLSIISYICDKDFSAPSKIETGDFFTPSFLFLTLIPFVAIFGSYSITNYHTNIISMFLLVLIALTFILVVFDKIPKKWYTFTVWIVSISLLYVSSLISPYVWGWDIQNEYYLANLVMNFSYWNSALPDAYNSMLSIVMLAPTYSLLTNLRLDYILKIVYPFLFSLVPLGLYKIFKTQTDNSKIAFIAVFLFISFNTFYIELLALTREMTAELFLVLLLLLILNRKLKTNLMVLMAIFSMGLVVSHYSTTYFFIIALIGVSILLAIFNLSKFNLSRDNINFSGNKTLLFVLPSITAFIILFAYLWYSSFSQGLAVKAIIDVLTYIKQDFFDIIKISLQNAGIVPTTAMYALVIFLIILLIVAVIYILKIILQRRVKTNDHEWITNFLDMLRSKLNYKVIAVVGVVVLVALTFVTGPPKTWIVTVLRYLNFTVVFFTFMGLVMVFLNMHRNKFQNTYLAFSVVGAAMLIAGFTIPSFEGAFNITRIYEIAFIILSPFCVIGGTKILGSIYHVIKHGNIDSETPLKIFSIFILIFMLFNTGFVSELAGESIPMFLTGVSIQSSDYYPLFDNQEADSAQWLTDNKVSNSIYADVYGKFIFYRFTPNINEISSNNGVSEFTTYNSSNTYMYLRTLNVNSGYLVGFTSRTDRNRVYKDLSSIANSKNKIFDDGGSRVYYK